MLAAVAQLERDQTSERTAAALAAKKTQGHRLGRPASATTRLAGARSLNLRADGLTWRAVAQALTDEGYATREDGPWHPPQRTARPAPSPSTATPPTNRPAMAPPPTPPPTATADIVPSQHTPDPKPPAAVTGSVGVGCAIRGDGDPIRAGSSPTVATIAPGSARGGGIGTR